MKAPVARDSPKEIQLTEEEDLGLFKRSGSVRDMARKFGSNTSLANSNNSNSKSSAPLRRSASLRIKTSPFNVQKKEIEATDFKRLPRPEKIQLPKKDESEKKEENHEKEPEKQAEKEQEEELPDFLKEQEKLMESDEKKESEDKKQDDGFWTTKEVKPKKRKGTEVLELPEPAWISRIRRKFENYHDQVLKCFIEI